jgi:hypothetical protein
LTTTTGKLNNDRGIIFSSRLEASVDSRRTDAVNGRNGIAYERVKNESKDREPKANAAFVRNTSTWDKETKEED